MKNRTALLKELDRINVLIDRRIIVGKPYKDLALKHKVIVAILDKHK